MAAVAAGFLPEEDWDEVLDRLGGAAAVPEDWYPADTYVEPDPEGDARLAAQEKEAYDRWYYTAMGREEAKEEARQALRVVEDVPDYAPRSSKRSPRPKPRPWLVYFISDGEGGNIKIGKSVDPARRMRSFQTHHANKLRLLATTGDYEEGELHRQFATALIRGEWYLPIRALLDFIREIQET